MAELSSAHTRPSQVASSAPAIHPRIACGPPIALTIRGRVMNGPTPIMSIMFSAVALPSPIPRINRGWLTESDEGVDMKADASSVRKPIAGDGERRTDSREPENWALGELQVKK